VLWCYYWALGSKQGVYEWRYPKVQPQHSQMIHDLRHEVATSIFGWSTSLLGKIGQVHCIFWLKPLQRSEIGQPIHLGAPDLQRAPEIPIFSGILNQLEAQFRGLSPTDLPSFRPLEKENPGAWKTFVFSSHSHPQRASVFPIDSAGFRVESPEEADWYHNLTRGMPITSGFRSGVGRMPFGFG
jgi:hypothetical protein